MAQRVLKRPIRWGSNPVRPWLAALVLSGLLVGCAANPLAGMDLPLPNRWFASAAATFPPTQRLTSTWWQSAKDPVLATIIAKIEADNLSVAQAKARVRAARAEGRSADYLPSLDANGSATFTQRLRRNQTDSTARNTSYYQAGITQITAV